MMLMADGNGMASVYRESAVVWGFRAGLGYGIFKRTCTNTRGSYRIYCVMQNIRSCSPT